MNQIPEGQQDVTTPPAATPNPVVSSGLSMLTVFKETLKGNIAQAFRAVDLTPSYWIVAFLATGLGTSLLAAMAITRAPMLQLAALLGKRMSTADWEKTSDTNRVGDLLTVISQKTIDGESKYGVLSAGEWFQLLLVGLLLVAAALLLRAALLKAVYAMRGQQISFPAAASVVAAAYTPLAFVSFGLFVLLLIPGEAFAHFLVWLSYIVVAVVLSLAELVLYVGMNKGARFAQSPMVPHVLLSWVWAAVMLGLYWMTYFSMLDGWDWDRWS